MNYRIRFTKGELLGKSFPIDNDALSIGRSKTNNVVLSAEDVSRRHVILTLGSTGIMLDNLSSRKTFVDGKVIAMGEAVTLVAGQSVTLGKSTEFMLESLSDDASTSTAQEMQIDNGATVAGVEAEGDATEGTAVGASAGTSVETSASKTPSDMVFMQEPPRPSEAETHNEPRSKGEPPRQAGSETVAGGTIVATPEDIAEIRHAEERRQKLHLLLYVLLGCIFVALMSVFYYFFLYKAPEKELGFPVVGGVEQCSDLASAGIESLENDIYIKYPVIPQMQVKKTAGHLDVVTGIGRDGNVPFYVMLEYDRNDALLHEDRQDSLRRWMNGKSEKDSTWNFGVPGPVQFFGMYNGIPYVSIYYNRMREGLSMYGKVLYMRHENMELALMEEFPATERWHAEVFLERSLLAFSERLIFRHWEGRSEKTGVPVKEALAEAETLLEGASPNAWTKVDYLLKSSLCDINKAVDTAVYNKAVDLLSKLREHQKIWYNSQLIAYKQAQALNDKAGKEQVKNTCLGIFSSPEDNRYYYIRKDVWK